MLESQAVGLYHFKAQKALDSTLKVGFGAFLFRLLSNEQIGKTTDVRGR